MARELHPAVLKVLEPVDDLTAVCGFMDRLCEAWRRGEDLKARLDAEAEERRQSPQRLAAMNARLARLR